MTTTCSHCGCGRRAFLRNAMGTVASTLILSGCRKSIDASDSGSDAAPNASTSTASVRFVDRAKESGLNYKWSVAGPHPLTILQTIGNGCAFLDFNNDGNLDILLVGPKLALYQGDGRGNFTDVTHATGLDTFHGNFLGCAVGDYNNDGFSDLYISGYQTGLLLQNNGGRKFIDVTQQAGLPPQPWGTSCGFADLTGNGRLDLYVGNYAEFNAHTNPQLCKFVTAAHGTVLSSCGPTYYQAIKGKIYHNQGSGRFVDVTNAWGGSEQSGRTLGVAFADYDSSGRVSFALANDETPGNLFHNVSSGRFEDVGAAAGVAHDRDGAIHGGMGIDWGDYDNDGKLDLFVATFQNEAKCLYHNDGGGLFTDVSYPSGIGPAALPYVAFGAKFLDADNDGWLDILIANGHVQDNIDLIENARYRQPIQYFQNSGTRPATFLDDSASVGLRALSPIVGRGIAVGDYDNDGRMDALVVNSEGAPILLHNESVSNAHQWVGFALTGAPGINRDAYGTEITLHLDGLDLLRQCQTAGSYLSASDKRVHFGLGSHVLPGQTIPHMSVRWPNGKQDQWRNVPIGRYLQLCPGRCPY